MKKIFTLIIMLTAIASATAFYSGEEIIGTKKYCKYTDGAIITISSIEMCPLSL